MTELELHQPTSIADQMHYAKTVSTASMLPDNYRGKPADIMLAVGLGQSMGLSPAESLYRIAVIKGKPTASAELIAANVRKAGHKLRVLTDEQAMSVRAVIIRADDPDFEFAVTRDLAWAKSMGLDKNDNYRKQPLTMLQWRAITAVARLAAPEALYGVSYTPDELSDLGEQRQSSASSLAEQVGAVPTVTAEQVVEANPEPETGEAMTRRSQGEMFALFGQKGISEDEQLPGINHICGTDYTGRGDLTEADARKVIAALRQRPDVDVPLEGGAE